MKPQHATLGLVVALLAPVAWLLLRSDSESTLALEGARAAGSASHLRDGAPPAPVGSCEEQYRLRALPHLHNLVLTTAAGGIPLRNIVRTLRSMHQSPAPPSVLVITSRATGERLRDYLLADAWLRGLRVCILDWGELVDTAFPAEVTAAEALELNVARIFAHAAALEFLRSGGAAHAGAVVFSSLPRDLLRLPDGLLLSDSRDVAFQRDLFAEMWCALALEAAAEDDAGDGGDGGAVGVPRVSDEAGNIVVLSPALSRVPPGRDVFGGPERVAALAARPYLVASVEAAPMTIGACQWNSKWLRECFGDAALDELGSRPILCSGGTVGTGAAMALYLDGMVPLALRCRKREGGADQGIHNALLHPWGGEDADEGSAAAVSRAVRRRLFVRFAHAEDAFIATVQYLKASGGITADEEGFMTARHNASVRVAMAHQYNRAANLDKSFGARFDDHRLAEDERARERDERSKAGKDERKRPR